MPLIKSIAGVRGTIGGKQGIALTPIDVVAITTAFGKWLQKKHPSPTAVVGRDTRRSGPIINKLVVGTLQSLGIHIIDLGPSTTPTVAMAIPMEKANGGIVITASHNPIEWNALKLFNQEGLFMDKKSNEEIFQLADQTDHLFATTLLLGNYTKRTNYIDQHIEKILALPLVATAAIKERKFSIAVDGINAMGGIAVPKLLQALGVAHIQRCNCEPNGNFNHNPEPLPEHLTTLSKIIATGNYDLGIAVDPDVDRLAIIDERGKAWGEAYTLVGVADYVLQYQSGNVVGNLSATNALRDITLQRGGSYTTAAVGEVNVVAKMKATGAIIGGEGNGGVIYPPLHYGRDALVGIALLLSHLATSQQTASALRGNYPHYIIIKDKIAVKVDLSWETIANALKKHYSGYELNTEDGIKVIQGNGWVQLRMSNTEPIIRIYAEATTKQQAEKLVREGMNIITYC